MTREDARILLEILRDWISSSDEDATDEIDALGVAIKALKQPEQKKGKWKITDAYPHNIYCSECFVRYAQTHWAVWEDGSLPRDYCPNCGAKMEKE